MRSETKIEVRNEDWSPGCCLSQSLKIGTRPCYGDRYCFPIYPPPPPGSRIRVKLLFSRSRGVKLFTGVSNGLLAALPHASPRRKILIATHWCCRVTPSPRWSVSRKNSGGGVKTQGGLGELYIRMLNIVLNIDLESRI